MTKEEIAAHGNRARYILSKGSDITVDITASQYLSLVNALEEAERKFAAFIKDYGTTYYPCPACGHGMTSRDGCLRCRVKELEEENKFWRRKSTNWMQIAKQNKEDAEACLNGIIERCAEIAKNLRCRDVALEIRMLKEEQA